MICEYVGYWEQKHIEQFLWWRQHIYIDKVDIRLSRQKQLTKIYMGFEIFGGNSQCLLRQPQQVKKAWKFLVYPIFIPGCILG